MKGIIFESHCKPQSKREKSTNWSNFKDFMTTNFFKFLGFGLPARAGARNEWVSEGWNVGGSGCRPKFVDGNCGTVDGSESVLRAWLYGRTFDFRVHEPSSRPVLTFLFIYFLFFFFFNLKFPIMPLSYFVIQFLILKHLEKNMI